MFRKKRKGQSILEYAILMGVIVAVIIVIQIYVKRAVQGKFKSSADQIGEQFTTGSYYTQQRITQTARQEDRETGIAASANVVERSQISDDASWAANLGTYAQKATDYKKAEINVTDYVQPAVVGLQQVGQHATMDSGILKNKLLFKDDE